MNTNEHFKRIAARFSVILHRTLGCRDGGRLGILVHHRVSPVAPHLPQPPFNVAPEVFRAQLVGLIQRGHRFVRLSDVLEARRQRTALPPRSVLLTFDDAYESVYWHAFPVLRELGVPASVFLSTAFLDSEEPFPFDDWSLAHRRRVPPEEYRPLKTEQCREMAASGWFEFGAHTHTHQDFRGRPQEFRVDLAQSVNIVRKLFALGEVSFAFPYGSTSRGQAGGELAHAARALGVSCALTTDHELVDPLVDDPLRWGRFICFPWDTAATLAAKLAGWHSWSLRPKTWLDWLRRRANISSIATATPCHSEAVQAAEGTCRSV